ncbi:hypothetical protein HQQ80_16790 [Microbacteriaceae bacterium VKM Ac-2855]|nr:hypothetical protein [Microbacteriaceae bacterium VKM Ac-2855]
MRQSTPTRQRRSLRWIILLNGGGFEGPAWSIRISLANLRDVQYAQIGKSLRAVALQYVAEWGQTRSAV